MNSKADSENTAINQTDAAIREAEKEFEKEGRLLDARKVMPELWKKHFGQRPTS